MPRLLPLIAATCAAVLLATGCTKEDPEPNYSSVTPTASATTTAPTTPPTSTSPTGVPTTGPNVNPGEVAPTAPAESRASSAEGAQSFASYYFKTLDWSYAVNSAELMDALFSPTCNNCKKLSDNLTATFERGTVTGTRITIKQIALVTNDGRNGATYAVDGVVDISAGQLKENATTAPIPAEPSVTITLWIKYMQSRWLVVSQAQA